MTAEEAKRKISEARKSRPSPRKGWHWKVIDGKRTWLPVKKEAKGVETQIQ